MDYRLLLVDENDRVTGSGEKMEVHRKGILHRAFSVFMINKEGKYLIQKRASEKYHSGGAWSNSCCSHQYENEALSASVSRCIADELGIPEGEQKGDFSEIGTFLYFSDLGLMKEHEVDHVLCYSITDSEIEKIQLNPQEVAAIRWMSREEIDDELEKAPQTFSSWFARAWNVCKNGKSV